MPAPINLKQSILDGWYNVLTGLGIKSLDKRQSTKYALSEILERQELIDIYRGDGLGKKIVDVQVNDMLRERFYVQGDPDDSIYKELKKIKAMHRIKEALTWGDLFGGSIAIIFINDGRDLSRPVNEDAIQEILGLQVYERHDITWLPEDLQSDERKPDFGMPEIYRITNRSSGQEFRVHKTRLLRFDGEKLPDQETNSNQGWGDSRLQAVFNRLRGMGDSLGGVETICTDFIVGVMKVSNLQQLMGSEEGETALRNRIKNLDIVKHIMNTIVVDKNEEFDRVTSSGVAGLRELIDVLIDVLCAVSGIPRVKLIGDQAKGLGSEAAGNIRLYYDNIRGRQDDDLRDNLEYLIRLIQLSKKGPFKGKEIDEWSLEFNRLWQPTDKEDEETRLFTAKRDTMYFEMGMPAEIILNSRFGGESYSRETVMTPEFKKMLREFKTEPVLEVDPNEEAGLNSREKDIQNGNNNQPSEEDTQA